MHEDELLDIDESAGGPFPDEEARWTLTPASVCEEVYWHVIDQYPDEDGQPVIYGTDLTEAEAESLVAEIEDADDGREPLLYDYLP